jgi:hypothetical protein
MTDDLSAVLVNCWAGNGGPGTCRWCRHAEPETHEPACPCIALALALQQRDALADYVKAEKRTLTMQAAVRLAKRPNRTQVRQRLDQDVLALETALARLRDLGIDGMVR